MNPGYTGEALIFPMSFKDGKEAYHGTEKHGQ